MTRPIGASFFAPQGTIHLIEAEKIYQIGDHTSTIMVKSDLVPILTSQPIEFKITILDCLVAFFVPGIQTLPNVYMQAGDLKSFKVNPFVQEPACAFDIFYKVTVVEIPYNSAEKVVFSTVKEGEQPEPPLAVIAILANDTFVQIEPLVKHEGKSFAIFVSAILMVNETL